MENITMPAECKLLLTPEGFYRRWQYWITITVTYKEAYYRTEAEVYLYFGTHKYKDFYSFKSYAYRRNKKKKKLKN